MGKARITNGGRGRERGREDEWRQHGAGARGVKSAAAGSVDRHVPVGERMLLPARDVATRLFRERANYSDTAFVGTGQILVGQFPFSCLINTNKFPSNAISRKR